MPDMIVVTLTEAEAQAAGALGLKREALRVARGTAKDYSVLDRGGSMNDRNSLGAIAEYALAKHYGPDTLRDWCENKAFSLDHASIPCDVGKNLHVRATKYRNGRLIAHPYDPDTGVFILARVEGLTITFVGWAWGEDVKQDRWWLNRGPGFSVRPAFVLPSSELLDMDQIPQGDIG